VEQWWQRNRGILARWVEEQGEHLSASQVESFREYCFLLRMWSERRNLVSRDDLPHVVSLHLCDCLSALSLMRASLPGPVMDLGSGAGLPGIPLAIMRPGLDFVLVEQRLGRAEFLQAVVRVLSLKHVRVVPARAQELRRDHRSVYSLVFSRAALKLPGLLRLTAPFLLFGGRLVVFKGPAYETELQGVGAGAPLQLARIRRIELPQPHGTRYLLVFTGD
jgi:16S rRNA (guanine527-N7)-methyltransferase